MLEYMVKTGKRGHVAKEDIDGQILEEFNSEMEAGG